MLAALLAAGGYRSWWCYIDICWRVQAVPCGIGSQLWRRLPCHLLERVQKGIWLGLYCCQAISAVVGQALRCRVTSGQHLHGTWPQSQNHTCSREVVPSTDASASESSADIPAVRQAASSFTLLISLSVEVHLQAQQVKGVRAVGISLRNKRYPSSTPCGCRRG